VPNFKYLCNFIHELLNVFEDPDQRVHTKLIKILKMINKVSISVDCKTERLFLECITFRWILATEQFDSKGLNEFLLVNTLEPIIV